MSEFRSALVAFTGKHEDELRKKGLLSVFSSFSFLISAANFTKRSLVLKDDHFLIGNYRVFSLFDSPVVGKKSGSLLPSTIISSKLHSLENAMEAISKKNSSKGDKYLLECYSGIGREELNELTNLSRELMSSREGNSYTRRFVSCISSLNERQPHRSKNSELDSSV